MLKLSGISCGMLIRQNTQRILFPNRIIIYTVSLCQREIGRYLGNFLCRQHSTKCTRQPKLPLPKNYFITTPIYYLNAVPHIGHLYTNVLADAVRRWYDILGVPVLFSTGTDEHGLKVQQAASAQKKDPVSFCDEISGEFRKLFQKGNINYTDYIRTTEGRHRKAVTEMWERLKTRGHIYKGRYEGWYSVSDETFVGEDQVKEVIEANGKTKKVFVESGHPVEWTVEENYMFRLSDFEKPLTDWLNKNVIHPDVFEPLVRQFITSGLPDLSVSRHRSRIPWGIPVPGDESQTIYVWLDALTNYLTVGGFPAAGHQWPVDCHVVGKDILRFHAIYWPAFLMAVGLEPPRSILCHSHWTMKKEKMSKSRGNVVDPFDRLEKYSADGLRYYLLKDGVPHSDGNYSDERAIECINSDVVNTFCNLLSRCSAKAINLNQIFPAFDAAVFQQLALPEEQNIMSDLYKLPDVVDEHYRNFNANRALDAVMGQLYRVNAFVQRCKPWEVIKSTENHDIVNCVLHVALENVRVAAIALLPATPILGWKVLDRLGCPREERTWYDMVNGDSNERPLGPDLGPLFPRIR